MSQIRANLIPSGDLEYFDPGDTLLMHETLHHADVRKSWNLERSGVRGFRISCTPKENLSLGAP